uniref:Putative ovule protein n=1 Tax=Solanum chacoense TaxID=4108 RepID=A0A0V0HSG9_SOLCH
MMQSWDSSQLKLTVLDNPNKPLHFVSTIQITFTPPIIMIFKEVKNACLQRQLHNPRLWSA